MTAFLLDAVYDWMPYMTVCLLDAVYDWMTHNWMPYDKMSHRLNVRLNAELPITNYQIYKMPIVHYAMANMHK